MLEDQIGFLLRVAMQRHTAIFLSKMVDGLTQAQFATLAKLYRGGCSQNELGRLISLDAATINGIIGRMKTRGMVAVKRDSGGQAAAPVELDGERPRCGRAGHLGVCSPPPSKRLHR